MYKIYILYSAQLNRYYVGFTGDSIEGRLEKHLAEHNGYTGKAKDRLIMHIEYFSSREAAMQREREIKSWKSSKKIKRLISSTE